LSKVNLFCDNFFQGIFLLKTAKNYYLTFSKQQSVMRKQVPAIFLIFFAFINSCTTTYQPSAVQYKDYRIAQNAPVNNDMTVMLKPYADSINKSMNDIIVVSATVLEKDQPEGTLGNVLADGMLIMAAQLYNTKVDAAFINSGGIRLQALPAGNITRGKVFELLPFDNIIVLQRVSGTVLKQFVDHIAGRGGWPCAGITFQLKNKKAVNIFVGGAPLDETAVYTIANNDYIANGGDDCTMLGKQPLQNGGFVFRDAIIRYFTGIAQKGMQLSSKIEKRVTNAE
jgi:2',3'-cyclic-nucleotide 2'-phosphodiesterase (5'-nucleotidase family)